MTALGIYLHIPFCQRKCAYCDFTSVPVSNQDDLIPQYLKALGKEISTYARLLEDTLPPIGSLYLGGGTPTILSHEGLALLHDRCQRSFLFDPAAEITIEANPENLNQEKLIAIRQAGFNRLSLGVQSFDDQRLQYLGRGHRASEALKAAAAARKAGFENLSIDLIYSLPGQGLADWREDLERALDLTPEHISTYALTLEEGTPLFRQCQQGEMTLPEEDIQVAMYQLAQEMLIGQGYHHYEISNFSLPSREARHNLLYWHNQEYLGLGAGAHSYLAGRRYFNTPLIENYIRAMENHDTAVLGEERPTLRQQVGETVMLGLRLMKGMDLSAFALRFGHTLQDLYPQSLNALIADGLLSLEDGSLKLTPRGILLSNEVFAEFL